MVMMTAANMIDDSASSTTGQPEKAFAGLSLEMDIDDHCFGDGDWASVIERSVQAGLAGGLSGPLPASELYVELVNNNESQELNSEYRCKDTPTNVLSFPGVEPDDLPRTMKVAAQGGPPVLLGDLIIADGVVVSEAADHGKTIESHLSHLVVHGVLHLLGYDHIKDEEAEEMEALEVEILAGLGIDDPYRVIE